MNPSSPCPCGGESYAKCCQPFHEGEDSPATAEALMRSRYSAFALKKLDYIRETTDPQAKHLFDWPAQDAWALQSEFTKLEVLSSSEDGNKGFVEFKAHYTVNGESHIHHERSRFRRQAGEWFFRDGKSAAPAPKPQG